MSQSLGLMYEYTPVSSVCGIQPNVCIFQSGVCVFQSGVCVFQFSSQVFVFSSQVFVFSSQVKQELNNLRVKSILRSGDDLTRMCARCKVLFGKVTNTGDVCPVCRFRVCKNCRQSLLTKGWLCTLCFKQK